MLSSKIICHGGREAKYQNSFLTVTFFPLITFFTVYHKAILKFDLNHISGISEMHLHCCDLLSYKETKTRICLQEEMVVSKSFVLLYRLFHETDLISPKYTINSLKPVCFRARLRSLSVPPPAPLRMYFNVVLFVRTSPCQPGCRASHVTWISSVTCVCFNLPLS